MDDVVKCQCASKQKYNEFITAKKEATGAVIGTPDVPGEFCYPFQCESYLTVRGVKCVRKLVGAHQRCEVLGMRQRARDGHEMGCERLYQTEGQQRRYIAHRKKNT